MARALSVRPPAILHALAAYGGQLWRAALSQPSPTALPQAAAGLLGRPEAGLGHSGPAQRAGNHLSPALKLAYYGPRGGLKGLPAAKPRERPVPVAGQSGARQPGANY